MRFDIMTLFPELVKTVLGESIIGRAQKSGAIEVCCHNIRDFSEDKHRRVDDTPYGGGKGMLMMAPPIYNCFRSIVEQVPISGEKPHVVFMSPAGKLFDQRKAEELASHKHIVILCGHYEGVDRRVIDEIVDEEISIGDYVLTGGELPALVLADSIARMLPGVLANEDAFTLESHYSGLLEYPQYTRPYEWHGEKVPDVLISGHHANIQKWQREQSLKRTLERRPDMLEKAELTKKDKEYLDKIKTTEE